MVNLSMAFCAGLDKLVLNSIMFFIELTFSAFHGAPFVALTYQPPLPTSDSLQTSERVHLNRRPRSYISKRHLDCVSGGLLPLYESGSLNCS